MTKWIKSRVVESRPLGGCSSSCSYRVDKECELSLEELESENNPKPKAYEAIGGGRAEFVDYYI